MTIWLIDSQGQLGNQLATFAHLIAHAIETKQVVVNPGFRRYAASFENFADNFLCRYPYDSSHSAMLPIEPFVVQSSRKILRSRHLRTNNKLIYYRSLGLSEEIDMGVEKFNLQRRRALLGILALDGWMFRDYEALDRNRHTVRQAFSYNATLRIRCISWLDSLKSSVGPLVGLHIRRGDFREAFPNLYFDDLYYMDIVQRLNKIFSPGKPVYIVCSNEHISDDFLCAIGGVRSLGGVAEDQFILSNCDYIVGPQSTYSSWASFVGGKPAHLLNGEFLPSSLKDFQVRRFP